MEKCDLRFLRVKFSVRIQCDFEARMTFTFKSQKQPRISPILRISFSVKFVKSVANFFSRYRKLNASMVDPAATAMYWLPSTI